MSTNTRQTYYKKNRGWILSKVKEYCETNKDKLSKQAKNKYNDLPEEEKNKNREHRRNRHYNMTEEEKNKEKRIWKKWIS